MGVCDGVIGKQRRGVDSFTSLPSAPESSRAFSPQAFAYNVSSFQNAHTFTLTIAASFSSFRSQCKHYFLRGHSRGPDVSQVLLILLFHRTLFPSEHL